MLRDNAPVLRTSPQLSTDVPGQLPKDGPCVRVVLNFCGKCSLDLQLFQKNCCAGQINIGYHDRMLELTGELMKVGQTKEGFRVADTTVLRRRRGFRSFRHYARG